MTQSQTTVTPERALAAEQTTVSFEEFAQQSVVYSESNEPYKLNEFLTYSMQEAGKRVAQMNKTAKITIVLTLEQDKELVKQGGSTPINYFVSVKNDLPKAVRSTTMYTNINGKQTFDDPNIVNSSEVSQMPNRRMRNL